MRCEENVTAGTAKNRRFRFVADFLAALIGARRRFSRRVY